MTHGVRAGWLRAVVRECQVLAGFAVPHREPSVLQLVADWLPRLPPPRSHVEMVLLRGLLLDLTMRWGDAEHRAAHRADPSRSCPFSASDIAADAWRDRRMAPEAACARWAQLYVRAFGRDHPTFPAMELRRQLNGNSSRPALIKDFCAQYGVSARRIYQDFRRLTGGSVQNYVTRKRLEAATILLTTTDEKVEWIASEVGWESRKNLNRALARHHGSSPRQVRRTHLERRSATVAASHTAATDRSSTRRKVRRKRDRPL